MKKSISFLFACLLSAVASYGHIENLSIKGGEKYAANQKVTITWGAHSTHNQGHFIYFTKSGNTGWNQVGMIPDNVEGNKSFVWTVPDSATTVGKIRIWQKNPTTPASNVSNDYNLISGSFTITGTTPILKITKKINTQSYGLVLLSGANVIPKSGAGVLPNGRLMLSR